MLQQRTLRRSTALSILLLTLASGRPALAQAVRSKAQLPAFQQVRKTVSGYFQTLPGYPPGCILTRTDVEPVFERLKRIGWVVADREAILAAMPSEGEFLVKQLRTEDGREFALRIAAYPHGYDRLDRLSRLPDGKATVRHLIHTGGGQDLVEYMATTPGGAELGEMLSQDPHGAHFNEPTGRIYTVDMLLTRLEQSYAAATETRPKSR